MHGFKIKLNNVEGVIVGITNYGMYQVDFDIEHDGHNCSGLAKEGHGFNVDQYFLTLIEDIKLVKIKWYRKGKFYDEK